MSLLWFNTEQNQEKEKNDKITNNESNYLVLKITMFFCMIQNLNQCLKNSYVMK